MKIGSEVEVKVVGKAVNRGGGYGMEVPCIYKFQGHKIYVDLLKKLLDIDNNLSVRHETRKRHSDSLNWTKRAKIQKLNVAKEPCILSFPLRD
jgi:hypothetical protein